MLITNNPYELDQTFPNFSIWLIYFIVIYLCLFLQATTSPSSWRYLLFKTPLQLGQGLFPDTSLQEVNPDLSPSNTIPMERWRAAFWCHLMFSRNYKVLNLISLYIRPLQTTNTFPGKLWTMELDYNASCSTKITPAHVSKSSKWRIFLFRQKIIQAVQYPEHLPFSGVTVNLWGCSWGKALTAFVCCFPAWFNYINTTLIALCEWLVDA